MFISRSVMCWWPCVTVCLCCCISRFISCWSDQQGTVSLTQPLCCVSLSLSGELLYVLYIWSTLRFTHFTFSGNFLSFFGNTMFIMYCFCHYLWPFWDLYTCWLLGFLTMLNVMQLRQNKSLEFSKIKNSVYCLLLMLWCFRIFNHCFMSRKQ